MTLTPEQKEHVIDLIHMGDQLDAVRYLQETLGVSSEEALMLAEKLEEEIEAEESPLKDEFESLQRESVGKKGLNVGRLVGTIFMSLGGIMLAVVAYVVVSNYQFEQRAIPVKGTVIDYQSHLSSNDQGQSTTMYTPVFQYDFKGKSYTYVSSTSSSSKEYEIDETVEVLVDPEEPAEILINSFWEKWFLPVLLGFMGTLFSGMGFMAYRVLGKPAV